MRAGGIYRFLTTMRRREGGSRWMIRHLQRRWMLNNLMVVNKRKLGTKPVCEQGLAMSNIGAADWGHDEGMT